MRRRRARRRFAPNTASAYTVKHIQVGRTLWTKDDGLELGDGTHIIYVNGATRSTSDIGKLVHDFQCSDVVEMHFDVLKKQVNQFKNSEEGRRVMCKAVEGLVEKGKRETMLKMAKRMLKDGILALKDVARYSGLSLAQVKKLQASMA